MPESQAEAARIDLGLVVLARYDGDRSAFSQLVRRHQGAVRAQLRRLCGADRSWADDMAQETFLLAWRKLAQFRGQARFATWLHCLAYTTFLQGARARKMDAQSASQNLEMYVDESEQSAMKTDLDEGMRHLTQGEQLALLHCYQLDLTHEEAAQVLGIPVGTVKTNVARGKAKLKDYLSAWNPESRE
jgi:RNA polymerase sigma factor (sigma-70 family)